MVIFVIEHLEPIVSKWVWLEYKHCSQLVGKKNLLITNIKNDKERNLLSKIAMVSEYSIVEVGCPENRIIVLDPQASRTLKPEDLTNDVDFIVIGGIMGDYPPKGRTWKLLTSRIPNCKVRNIGPFQFSVDGALYIAYMVSKGKRVEEIPIIENLEIKVSENFVIILPYAYPLVNGKPFISNELINYLINDIEKDETEALRSGKVRSISD